MIVVCDTENIEVGIPSITYSLRGIVAVQVDVSTARMPVHSGMAGGALPDAAIALNTILGRLYLGQRPAADPRLLRPGSPADRQGAGRVQSSSVRWRPVPQAISAWCRRPASRSRTGYDNYAQTWRRPAVTVIAQEASSIKGASNQVLPKASAIVSCRIVPDQKPDKVLADLTAFLTKDPPWGCEVRVTPHGPPVEWWMTDPNGPAFEAALAAMRNGFDRDPVAIGCGGSIGFVGPLSELFGGAPALLMGIEDPASNAHAPNESLHEGDFKKLMASLVRLFDNLGKLTPSRMK